MVRKNTRPNYKEIFIELQAIHEMLNYVLQDQPIVIIEHHLAICRPNWPLVCAISKNFNLISEDLYQITERVINYIAYLITDLYQL